MGAPILSQRFLRPLRLGLCLSLVMPSLAGAEDVQVSSTTQGGYIYSRPKLFDFVKQVPCDLADCSGDLFNRKNLLPLGVIGGSTAILLLFDQKIVNGASTAGDHMKISHNNHIKTFMGVIPYPDDNGAALYYIGDGMVDVLIAGGFFGTGLATSDNRALQTSRGILESIIATGLVTQVIKHVSGRESPYVATGSGGKWTPFPRPSKYAKDVPHYDAFPSGHLAAAMATVTVIGENYPDYPFVRPVGYTLMTALGFQMLNNGVHWASDYPLAIGLGYVFGRAAARRGKKRAPDSQTSRNDFQFTIVDADGAPGIGIKKRF